jgi:hypothetical protein
MRTQKFILWHSYIDWFVIFITMSLMLAAYVMNGFPYPMIAVVVTMTGLLWGLLGLLLALGTAYFAWRQKIMSLWCITAGMSAMSFYAFMSLASTY